MSSIKGPPRGGTIPSTASEQREVADKVSQSGTRQPTALENQERQTQNALGQTLLRGKNNLSAADAERLVSQAGYQRAGAKKKSKNFDVGDSAQSPIPLPVEDSEDAEWSQSSLQEAQSGLTQQSSAFLQAAQNLAEGDDLQALWEKVLSENYGQGDEDILKMQAAMQAAASEPQGASLDFAQMSRSADALFGVNLGNADPGHALVAAALMVAGVSEAVVVIANEQGGKDTLEPKKLAGGVQNLVQGGHTAVEDARKMNQGIDKNLSIHRTFVFKR